MHWIPLIHDWASSLLDRYQCISQKVWLAMDSGPCPAQHHKTVILHITGLVKGKIQVLSTVSTPCVLFLCHSKIKKKKNYCKLGTICTPKVPKQRQDREILCPEIPTNEWSSSSELPICCWLSAPLGGHWEQHLSLDAPSLDPHHFLFFFFNFWVS